MRFYWSSLIVSILLAHADIATAQRLSFERTFEATTPMTVEVSTVRGKIAVKAGPAGRITIQGTATARAVFGVPADAAAVAARIASAPPIERIGNVIRLLPPATAGERRAVTIAYDVFVPAGTVVSVISDSGAVAVAGLSARTTVRTQSSGIHVADQNGELDVTSGSGAVTIDGAAGAASVVTSSGAISVRDAKSSVRIRSQSGAISTALSPASQSAFETDSSAITVTGAGDDLRVRSQSGRILVTGQPTGEWVIHTGSGAVDVTLDRGDTHARFNLTNRSGGIAVPAALITETVSKHHVGGRIGDGTGEVAVESGSGAIVVRRAD